MSTSESSSTSVASTEITEPGSQASKPPKGRRWLLYEIIAVVVIVVAVVVAYSVTGDFGRSGDSSSTTVLVPGNTDDSIPAGQFDAISFVITSTSTVSGTLFNSFGIQFYTMSPTELFNLSRTDVVSGYEWTSGPIHNDTTYDVDVSVPPGHWYFVSLNPSLTVPTALGYYTALTLTTG
jgi:hypothetical protein